MKQPLLWVLIACFCWTPLTLTAQHTGRIEGVVLDEVTETPIADVNVTLSATQLNSFSGTRFIARFFVTNL